MRVCTACMLELRQIRKKDSQGAEQGRHVRQDPHHGIVSPKMTTPPVKMIIVCTGAFQVLLAQQQVQSLLDQAEAVSSQPDLIVCVQNQ